MRMKMTRNAAKCNIVYFLLILYILINVIRNNSHNNNKVYLQN